MMKILSPTTHGVLDYLLAIAFLAAPAFFGFESEAAASLARIIGIAYLIASFVTRYPLGALKWIPFPVHGALEAITAVSWIVMPWLFGFAADIAARNFFVVAGVGLLAVCAITNYRAADYAYGPGAHERRVAGERHSAGLGHERHRSAGPRIRFQDVDFRVRPVRVGDGELDVHEAANVEGRRQRP